MSETPGPSHTGLSWPIVTIDFEASSLEQDGYPIEVGLAVWFSLDQPMLGWSTLIRPIRDWTSNGQWSVASAKVHGIRGGDLVAHGREPGVIAAALNEVVGASSVAWCDGGPYDAHWLAALFKVGKVQPAFTLGDWDRLVGKLDQAGRERAWTWMERAPSRHRARQDVEVLLLALMEGIGVEPRSRGRPRRSPARAATFAKLAPTVRQWVTGKVLIEPPMPHKFECVRFCRTHGAYGVQRDHEEDTPAALTDPPDRP